MWAKSLELRLFAISNFLFLFFKRKRLLHNFQTIVVKFDMKAKTHELPLPQGCMIAYSNFWKQNIRVH